MSKVIGYKMTSDTGFAPNPFHGCLTLATCKPAIRRTRREGDWLAGFASQTLVANARRGGVNLPYMGLVYLMQVTEAPISLGKYYSDGRFQIKKPIVDSNCSKLRCGDNIYQYINRRGYRQHINLFHDDSCHARDIGGVFALVSNKFWYFGRNAFIPGEGWQEFLGTPLSEARTFHCPEVLLDRILDHFGEIKIGTGVHGEPSIWPPRVLQRGVNGRAGC